MSLLFIEDGSDSTYGLEPWSSVTGTVASSSTQANTGPRSLALSTTNSHVNVGNLSAARKFSWWVRPADFGAVGGSTFFLFMTGTLFRRNSTGKIDLLWKTSASDSGTIVVPNNAWTHIQVLCNSDFTNVSLYINGALDYSSSHPADGLTSPFDFGFWHGANSGTTYLDDFVIDDSSNQIWFGTLRCTYKGPASLNTNNFDTGIGSGTNRYDRVAERAISLTNGWQHAASSDVQENYGIQDASAGDVDISDKHIVGYGGWIYGKRGAFDTQFVRQIGTVQTKT